MPFTREDIRESVERAGDAHWKALRDHHEDAYPASRPTPGDVCKAEAERLNEMGLGGAKEFELVETRDRKSTRLNSSHGYISYAVFCLKKKKSSVFESIVPSSSCSSRFSGVVKPASAICR